MGLDGCVKSVERLISHGSVVTSKEGLPRKKDPEMVRFDI